MRIPHSRPQLDEADIEAVTRALRAGHLAQGSEVEALEQECSALFGGLHAVAVSSGTAALYLALKACGMGRDHTVLMPTYACNSLYAAVSLTGATPRLADCGPRSVNITPEKPGEGGTPSAIIVPHAFGFIADVEGFKALGRPVIEDCAQAFGGRYPDGTCLGTRGDVGIFSLYATKMMPVGEGGLCVTRSEEKANLIRRLRQADEQAPDARAFNFKMSDLCAALARSRLGKLEQDIQRREMIARRYDEQFGRHAWRAITPDTQSVCFRYLLNAPGGAARAIQQAETRGILCRTPIWNPLHKTLGGVFPVADRWQEQLLSVPLYPNLTDDEVEWICKSMTAGFAP